MPLNICVSGVLSDQTGILRPIRNTIGQVARCGQAQARQAASDEPTDNPLSDGRQQICATAIEKFYRKGA
jgi:hypothetical protein